MAGLTGDQGARKLLDQWGDRVIDLAMTDDALLFDVDTRMRWGACALPIRNSPSVQRMARMRAVE